MEAFSLALKQCDAVSCYSQLWDVMNSDVRPWFDKLLHTPFTTSVSDYASTDESCPHVAAARDAISKPEMGTDDLWFFLYELGNRILDRSTRKRSRSSEAVSPQVVVTNVFTFFCNRSVPKLDKMCIRWPFLKKEKNKFEASDEYTHANASERRKLQMSTVLSVFSERAHRHTFTSLWLKCIHFAGEAELHAHLLYRLGTTVLPSLTNPLVVADYLSECFRSGGLIAVLALQGIFLLMVDHGLEYPQYYEQLYSLISADAFASRHRYDLFRLLNLSMSSVRVPSYIVASVIKRTAQVCLLAPSPTLYFALPFIRTLLQAHPNCLVLIHRRSKEAVIPEEFLSGSLDSSVKAKSEATQRTAQLFEGVDPFSMDKDFASSYALCSTLWEFTALEKHFLPTIPLMISAFSSAAEDKTPLRFEKSYGRLFTAEVTRTMSRGSAPPVAYQEPAKITTKDMINL